MGLVADLRHEIEALQARLTELEQVQAYLEPKVQRFTWELRAANESVDGCARKVATLTERLALQTRRLRTLCEQMSGGSLLDQTFAEICTKLDHDAARCAGDAK